MEAGTLNEMQVSEAVWGALRIETGMFNEL
jgi:hypothetical protein